MAAAQESNYALAFVHLSAFFFGNALWTYRLNGLIPVTLPFNIGKGDITLRADEPGKGGHQGVI